MSGAANEPAGAYDVVVVGSSPLLLIEALYLERQGKRVAILEGRDRLGGAWYTIPLFGLDGVEVGCHYVERAREGYAFLEDDLGVPLEPHSVKAVWFHDHPEREGGIVKRALWWRLLSDDVWGVIKGIDRRDPAKCLRALRRMLVSPAYRYPVGGARALVDRLADLVAESSIDLRMETPVDGFEFESDGAPVRCLVEEREILTDRVVIGQHSVPWLVGCDSPGASEPRFAMHALLRITGEKRVPFDYLEIHRNDVIQRIDDKTPYALGREAEDPTDLILCCHLTGTRGMGESVDPDEIFDHLAVTGVLRRGALLMDAHVEVYPHPELSDAVLPDSVTVFRTYDLGVGLERNAERWRAVLRR
jgi:hypothetical protein